jgi:hypothetical protein
MTYRGFCSGKLTTGSRWIVNVIYSRKIIGKQYDPPLISMIRPIRGGKFLYYLCSLFVKLSASSEGIAQTRVPMKRFLIHVAAH